MSARNHDDLGALVRGGPPFRALLRAVECRLFKEAGRLPDPLLDLGCNDGLFAMIAHGRRAMIGIDLDERLVREAAARGVYRHVLVASATALPFLDDHFGSIAANCVIEHIPDIEAVIRESARVLRPGGRFVFGVPSEHFSAMLLGVGALQRLGLRRLAGRYGSWFHRHSRHFHVDSVATWRDRLERHGFEMTHVEPYIDERAHELFDLLHYISVPWLISRVLTGRWNALPNPMIQAFFEALLRPLYQRPPPARGAYHFFHANRR